MARPERPVVAVTLARLKLTHTFRFMRWGKPVEAQMLAMVNGRDGQRDGESHRVAMVERARSDFHHEFTTMRFMPLGEFGVWAGRSNYTQQT